MRYKDTDYEIFEDGKCFSYKSNKFLKPQMSLKYPTYNLTINGKKKKTYVHRMVAETYLPRVRDKNIVNHIDGNTHNFQVSNLEWVSESENSIHAVKMGLLPKSNQTPVYYTGDNLNEIWKPAQGYNNYLVSSFGRIMNKNTKRLLKLCISNTGYYYVNLFVNNKGKIEQIHQLVYKNFFSDYSSSKVINHIDGNKLNNNINNLELISYKENNLHAVYQIKTNPCAKQVVQMTLDGKTVNIYPSITKATRSTKINNISRAVKNGTTAGGFKQRIINE